MALEETLSNGPSVSWFIAVVHSLQLSVKSVTVTYLGGQVTNVGYLTSYIPVVGDQVHGLLLEGQGMLILGKKELRPTITPPTPPGAVTLAPTGRATYTLRPPPLVSSWGGTTVRQSYTEQGAWFYSQPALAAITLVPWAKFEIQLTLDPGSEPLGFVLHGNVNQTVAFIAASSVQLRDIEDSVSTWVALPLAWADALVSGAAKGVGLVSDIYSASASAGGTLRFTPL